MPWSYNLTSRPTITWKRSFKIHLSGHRHYLRVDLDPTGLCSCDQYLNPTRAVCRADRKVTFIGIWNIKQVLSLCQDYLRLNPCATASNCGDCLLKSGCNWFVFVVDIVFGTEIIMVQRIIWVIFEICYTGYSS